ncbi:MAG: hypothetical protein EBQ94_10905, partial [Flavobacteriales bacterium]|nr:hypothetical protein [Flavobacteriales bacterium]
NATITDRAGAGNYANNTNEWITIAGRPGVSISISGSYGLEACCDRIYIRSGYGNAGTALQTLSAASGTTSYTGACGESLTVHLTSDVSNVSSGFSFTVTYSTPQTATSTVLLSGQAQTVSCGTNTVIKDHAGDNTSYGNSRNDFIVFNNTAGSTATLNLTGRYATESSYDFLSVFQGTGTGGTLVYGPLSGTGAFNFTGSPGVTYTLQFTSDGSNVAAGFSLFASYTGSCSVCTAPTAPTSITGTNAICSGSSTTLTTSGGSLGTEGIDLWYAGGACPTNAFLEHWSGNTNPYCPSTTTVNSVTGGNINLTSTSADPNINMTGLGSFSPSTNRYVNVRFRVTSVTQVGAMEIFWYNTAFPTASGSQYKNQPITSVQNVWQTVSIDMGAPTAGTWTSSNVTGWRFDWTTNSGVTMDIDFISLSSQPIVGTGTTLTVSPGSTTTYYTAKQGSCGLTTCASQTVTVGPQATPGTFQYANGSTQTICPGSTISCTNSTSPTNGGANTLSVVWYCGELLSGLPGSGTYGNWVRSTTAATGLLAATGTNATALTNYNPLTDFPGKTNFLIIRRAFTNVCGECAGPGSCLDQSFYLNVNAVSAAPAITGTYCPGATTVSGTGINGSTISVIRGGSSIGTATVSGGVWTATVSTLAAGNVLTATQTQSGLCVSVASASNTVLSPSTAPTINATICPGGTTVSGTGVNGSTISVIRSGSSIGTATVSGGVWTATVSTVNAGDVITATQTTSGACVSAASSSVTVRPIINWGNLQFPGTTTICGTTTLVYGQVYIAGITDPAGVASNLTAELGWSSSNTNPNTWTNWTSASFNVQSGNNDEFVASLGAGLTTGTWYYAYRYSYFGCSYLYGGTAGIWSSGNSGVATVPSSQTISLSSSAGTNIQTVCKGTAITNITYAVGNGGNNAGVTGLPTGVSGSFSGGTFTISGSPSVSGVFNYTVTTSGPSNCPVLLTGTITVNETLDYANLQFPPTAAICAGGSANIFGQVYEAGLTEAGGQGAGVTVHCGISPVNTNSNPNTWSSWTAATFNTQSGNNDEYQSTIGSALSAGTYYYAFRYSYNGCIAYGGYSGGGGGFWDGSSNISGVLTVNPTNTTGTASSSPTLCINTALTTITHTTTSATGISNSGVSGANGLPAGVSATWSSNTITITGTPSASGTFNYSIPLTGGCGTVNATGTIIVTPVNSAGAASSSPTLCNNSPLTTITHSTVGASGVSNSGVSGANGLPAGVSAAWSSNTISITGTPTVAGTYPYSIPLTGGCGSVNAT